MKKENGLSNCAKITIVKLVIQNLSDFCNDKDEFTHLWCAAQVNASMNSCAVNKSFAVQVATSLKYSGMSLPTT